MIEDTHMEKYNRVRAYRIVPYNTACAILILADIYNLCQFADLKSCLTVMVIGLKDNWC